MRRLSRWAPGLFLLACVGVAPADACVAVEYRGPLTGGALDLPAEPGRHYLGWLFERGRVVALRDGERRLSASPPRWARLPLAAQADSQGRLRLPLEAGEGLVTAGVALRLDCADAAEATLGATLAELHRLAAEQAERGDASSGARLAWALLRLRWEQSGRGDWVLWSEQQLAALALRAGFLEQAAAWAERVAELAGARGERGLRGLALLDRGRALLSLDAAAAEAAQAEAVALLDAEGIAYYAVVAQHERCILARLRGALDAAIACYEQVAPRFAALGEAGEQINSDTNRVTALLMAGRHAEGRAVLLRNLARAEAHGDGYQRARLALLEAQLASWAGDYERALAALFAAREHFAAAHNRRMLAHVDRLLGATYSLAGEAARALDYYRKARAELAALGLQRAEALVLLSEARALARLGELAEAQARAQQAEGQRRGDQARQEWRSSILLLADLALRQQQPAAAQAWLGKLDGVLSPLQERQRLRLQAELGGDAALADAELQHWLTRGLDDGRLNEALHIGRLLVERRVRRGQGEQAAAIVEQVGKTVAPLLARLRTPGLRDAVRGELQGLYAGLAAGWTAGPVDAVAAATLVGQLDALLPIATGAAVEVDSGALAALERQVGRELLGLGEGDPETRDRALLQLAPAATPLAVTPTPLAWAAADTLVYPVLRRDHGGLLLARLGRWHWQPIDLAQLRSVRRRLHAGLAAGHEDATALDALAAELAVALGAKHWLGQAGPLWVVAHAELAGLPLEWLRHRLAPGQAALGWLRRAGAGAEPLPAAPASLHLVTASADRRLPGLPALQPEIAALREAWQGLAVIELGHSRRQLLAALARPQALLHVAAHGRGAVRGEEESGLWLHGDDSTADSDAEMEFVSALGLRSQPVRAGLVVLAACESGYSHAVPALGFGGVADSLIDAGAGAVVATRWPVGDRNAQRFSAAFHRALARAPNAPEWALEQARDALRRNPASRHPTHWAGWFVIRQGPPAADIDLALSPPR